MTTVLIIPIIKSTTRWYAEHTPYFSMLGYPIKSDRMKHAPFWGTGSISGTVRVNGVLASRRVTILERNTCALVATTQSDAVTGEFVFANLSDEKDYIVIADDINKIYNASVADWVQVNAN